jgi:aldehyde dehydrogenase (NAD+)
VHESVAEAFCDRLVEAAQRLRIGPALEDPDVAPLANVEQYEKVMTMVGRVSGKIRAGGRRPSDQKKGLFLLPTVADRVSPSDEVATTEIFGPVATLTPFIDEQDAIRIANALPYGLAAGIQTLDVTRAMRVVRELEAGSVWVNGWFLGGVQAPNGGVKDSGVGRERGLPGIANYLSIKNVAIRI